MEVQQVTGIEKKEEPNKQTGFWVIKTNKMHFFFLYFNNLSSTCFEESNYSSSEGGYCIRSILYLSC